MSDTIFHGSDLATTKRSATLEELAKWSKALLRLDALIRRETRTGLIDLGDLAWLRPFDVDDLREFAAELNDVLLAAYADHDLAVLNRCLADWRTTARQLQDPLRRSVLLDRHRLEDFIEAERPGGAAGRKRE